MSTINNTDVFLIGRSTTNYQVSAADLSAYVSQSGSRRIPAGSQMLFDAATAPTGWTQVTDPAYNDATIQVVTSAGGGTGGSIEFLSLFNSSSSYAAAYTITSGNVGNTTLTVGQIPSHTHSTTYGTSVGAVGGNSILSSSASGNTAGTGGSAAHTHSLAGAAVGTAVSDFAVKYLSLIICTKS